MFNPCSVRSLTFVLCGLALLQGTAQARDLTVASWGGAYQDVQRKIFFEPYSQASGNPRQAGRSDRRGAR